MRSRPCIAAVCRSSAASLPRSLVVAKEATTRCRTPLRMLSIAATSSAARAHSTRGCGASSCTPREMPEHGSRVPPRCRSRRGSEQRLRLGGTSHESADVHALLAELPERQRHALFLRYYADLEYGTIGEALEISGGTVGATLNQARENLRRLMVGVKL